MLAAPPNELLPKWYLLRFLFFSLACSDRLRSGILGCD